MSDLPARISLREVGPRDGLQNEAPVSTAAKVELVDALSRTGVRRIETVSFVSPRAIPQMADADEVWAAIEHAPSITYSALVPNLRGAVRALDAGCRVIEIVVSASDTHNRANVNRSTAESLDDIARVISLAHEQDAVCHVTVATAWGCPYEGDVPVSRVVSVASRAVADGADGLSFGDTTGMATPTRVTELVGSMRMAVRGCSAESALPQHAGDRAGERAGGVATRRRRLRRQRRRARRMSLRTRGFWQSGDRRTRATWSKTWASRPASISRRSSRSRRRRSASSAASCRRRSCAQARARAARRTSPASSSDFQRRS